MQAAALFVTACGCAEEASTYGARQYFLGVRDSWEAIFRATSDVPDDGDPYRHAVIVLAGLGPEDRDEVLGNAQRLLRERRKETISDTVTEVAAHLS